MDRHTQAPYAKFGLVSIGAASEVVAVRLLLDEGSSRTVREAAARASAGWTEAAGVPKGRSKSVDLQSWP